MSNATKRLTFFLLVVLSFGCSSVYYKFWETFGQEKRDLLRSNVEAAQDEQENLEEEFKDTISRIRSEYKFDAGNLEETYDELSEDLEDAESRATALSDRIDRVEDIAGDLFAEWRQEISELSNPKFKRDSKRKLQSTQKKFTSMLKAMRQVENNIEPILRKFRDQVIYLKHNLNAAALGAFKTEFAAIEGDIEKLLRDISASTSQASAFIDQLE